MTEITIENLPKVKEPDIDFELLKPNYRLVASILLIMAIACLVALPLLLGLAATLLFTGIWKAGYTPIKINHYGLVKREGAIVPGIVYSAGWAFFIPYFVKIIQLYNGIKKLELMDEKGEKGIELYSSSPTNKSLEGESIIINAETGEGESINNIGATLIVTGIIEYRIFNPLKALKLLEEENLNNPEKKDGDVKDKDILAAVESRSQAIVRSYLSKETSFKNITTHHKLGCDVCDYLQTEPHLLYYGIWIESVILKDITYQDKDLKNALAAAETAEALADADDLVSARLTIRIHNAAMEIIGKHRSNDEEISYNDARAMAKDDIYKKDGIITEEQITGNAPGIVKAGSKAGGGK